MKSYTVTIRKEHCINTQYRDCRGCALYRAIQEQLPGFPLKSVGGNYVRDMDHNRWCFAASPDGWTASKMENIKKGIVKECVVTFSLDVPEEEHIASNPPEPKKEQPIIKKRIVYVAVPESIKEQSENLIMS